MDGVRFLKKMPTRPCPQEGLLDRVLGAPIVMEDGPCDPVDAAPVSVEQSGACGRAVLPRGLGDPVVGLECNHSWDHAKNDTWEGATVYTRDL